MTETILVALITGGLSLLGVIITSNKTTRDVEGKLDKQQAVTETRLEEQIKVVNHRIADLEHNTNN